MHVWIWPSQFDTHNLHGIPLTGKGFGPKWEPQAAPVGPDCFLHWLRQAEHSLFSLIVFSGGSRTNSETRAGFHVCYRRDPLLGPDSQLIQRCIPLGDKVEVFDAEVSRTLEGTYVAINHIKDIRAV